jgi:hypothetical protein
MGFGSNEDASLSNEKPMIETNEQVRVIRSWH